jgi:hypothetical protein
MCPDVAVALVFPSKLAVRNEPFALELLTSRNSSYKKQIWIY